MDDIEKKTPKEKLESEFTEFTETQLTKLVEAFFIINWINDSITIDRFIIILFNDYDSINV